MSSGVYVLTPISVILIWFSGIVLATDITINEVMANPQNASDEWFEIWNPNNLLINLSDWKINISDGLTKTSVTCDGIPNCSLSTNATYFIIIKKNANINRITNENIVYFNTSNTGAGWLANEKRTILIYNQSGIIANKTYEDPTNNTGISWARLEDGTFQFCNTVTPGLPNNCDIPKNQTNIKISSNLISAIVNVSHIDIFDIFIEGKTNCSLLDSISISYNIKKNGLLVVSENFTVFIGCDIRVGNWTPNVAGEYELCGWIVNSTANNANMTDDSVCMNITVVGTSENICDLRVYIAAPEVLDLNVSSTLDYNITINDILCNGTEHAVNVTYNIDDFFGNSIRSAYVSSTNIICDKLLQRSWSSWPNLLGSEAYIIKVNISTFGCEDANLANNYAEKMFVVRGNLSASVTNSSINITSINIGSDGSVKWGESFDVWIDIYRGNTSKYAIDIWVQSSDGTRVSDVSTIHALQKWLIYKTKIPILMKSNCDNKYYDGDYIVVAEGLDQRVTKSINVADHASSVCIQIINDGGDDYTDKGKKQSDFEIIEYPQVVAPEEPFEIVVRMKNNAPYTKKFTLYSYVYNRSKLISEGWSNGWRRGWDANSISIEIQGFEERLISLKNRIKNGTEQGQYKIKIHIVNETDLEDSISVSRDVYVESSKISNETEENIESIMTNITSESGKKGYRVENRPGGFITGYVTGSSSQQEISSWIIDFSNITDSITRQVVGWIGFWKSLIQNVLIRAMPILSEIGEK